MTLAEGAGAPNVLVDARYRAIQSVIPRVIPVNVTLSCTGGEVSLGVDQCRASLLHKQHKQHKQSLLQLHCLRDRSVSSELIA